LILIFEEYEELFKHNNFEITKTIVLYSISAEDLDIIACLFYF